MAKRFSRQRPAFDGMARGLHWLVAVLVVTQFIIGWTMPDVRKDTQPVGLIGWHLGVGTLLISVMVVRVVWRMAHRPPPGSTLPVFATLSAVTHFLLYALLLIVPLLGWINASSRAWSVRLAGVIPYPALSATGSPFGHSMGNVHGILAWVLFALIVLHIAAVLFHTVVLRDGILRRMLP